MKSDELILVVEQFKNGLISRATDGSMMNVDYKSDRQTLLNEPSIKDLLPQYIKSRFPTYQERREFLRSDFNNILYSLEQDMPVSLSNQESYELGERLGNGGYGEVYKFHHTLLNIHFAVKILDHCL